MILSTAAIRWTPRHRVLVLVSAVMLTACHSTSTSKQTATAPPVEIRIGMAYGPRVTAAYENRPTPLFYGGGFLPKIPVFETLVGMNESGAPTPGLATRWDISSDRRVYTFHLREGARFHDGRDCDAEAVAAHFRRLGSDEDMFIGMFRYLQSVEAVSSREVRFRMTRPYPLLQDLCILNPNAIVVPEAPRDAEPAVLNGTGPFRFESFRAMDSAVYRENEGYSGPAHALESFAYALYPGANRGSGVLTWALERGHVDAIIESWAPTISRSAAVNLAKDPRFELHQTKGSSVTLLALNQDRPAFRDIESRRYLASIIDRAELVDYAENGFADPIDTLFAFGVGDWPEREPREAAVDAGPVPQALTMEEPVLLVSEDPRSLLCGAALARRLARHGITVRVETNTSGSAGWDRVNRRDYDIHLTRTWGAPYDPHVSLIARFSPAPDAPTAVETIPIYEQAELTRLIEESFAYAPGSTERRAIYRDAQALLDREVAVIPLFASRRIAMTSNRVQGFQFGPNGYGLDLTELRLAR